MPPPPPKSAATTDPILDELGDWLMKRCDGIYDVSTLEGFLTAILIGPTTLLPSVWLPKIWGHRQHRFRSREELDRFMTVFMFFYNELEGDLDEEDIDEFYPTFYVSGVGRQQVEVVDEWCFGFMKGMRLDSKAWAPLKKERPELLKPIELFGSPRGWKEIEASGNPEKMHRLWSKRIAPSVHAIQRFWMPYRRASVVDIVRSNKPTRH